MGKVSHGIGVVARQSRRLLRKRTLLGRSFAERTTTLRCAESHIARGQSMGRPASEISIPRWSRDNSFNNRAGSMLKNEQ